MHDQPRDQFIIRQVMTAGSVTYGAGIKGPKIAKERNIGTWYPPNNTGMNELKSCPLILPTTLKYQIYWVKTKVKS